LEWLKSFVFQWLETVLSPLRNQSEYSTFYTSLCTRLEFYLLECFAALRISELFDLIIDYPDSIPALEDLKSCLIKTNQLSELIESLRQV
jgi:anaphase-promoting complex subunit 2